MQCVWLIGSSVRGLAAPSSTMPSETSGEIAASQMSTFEQQRQTSFEQVEGDGSLVSPSMLPPEPALSASAFSTSLPGAAVVQPLETVVPFTQPAAPLETANRPGAIKPPITQRHSWQVPSTRAIDLTDPAMEPQFALAKQMNSAARVSVAEETPKSSWGTIHADFALSPPAPAKGGTSNPDPELGNFLIEEIPPVRPPANPVASPDQPTCDPELGCLRIIEAPPILPPTPPDRSRRVFLFGGVNYTRNTNVFAGVDPVDDGFLQTGLLLYGVPSIGRNTFLEFTVANNLIRYSNESQIDYNETFIQAGILHRLSPEMLIGLGWSNQQLFLDSNQIPSLDKGSRFLNDHSVRVEVRRQDRLSPRLNLSTYYRFQWAFSDPEFRSRIINAFFTGLTYDVQPNLQVGLDYNLALTTFTEQNRSDFFNQISARFTYTIFRNTRLGLFGGYSFGNSSDSRINFNGFVFGVGLNIQIGLF